VKKITVDISDTIHNKILDIQYTHRKKTGKFLSIHDIIMPALEKEFGK
jgi:hypothetical protein